MRSRQERNSIGERASRVSPRIFNRLISSGGSEVALLLGPVGERLEERKAARTSECRLSIQAPRRSSKWGASISGGDAESSWSLLQAGLSGSSRLAGMVVSSEHVPCVCWLDLL